MKSSFEDYFPFFLQFLYETAIFYSILHKLQKSIIKIFNKEKLSKNE